MFSQNSLLRNKRQVKPTKAFLYRVVAYRVIFNYVCSGVKGTHISYLLHDKKLFSYLVDQRQLDILL